MQQRDDESSPKSLKDPAAVEQRLSLLHEPHIAPLTEFVQRLRSIRGDGFSVPWFDPLSGGVNARALLLFEAPGPRATGPEGPRSAERGSGFISPDNNDESAKNLFLLLAEAGLDRKDLVIWNIVPWYVGDRQRIREVTDADINEASPYLAELLTLLPRLKVVMPMGKAAQKGWKKFSAGHRHAFAEISAPHTSPQLLNTTPEARPQILEALMRTASLLGSP